MATKGSSKKVGTPEVTRLARYWFRADLMHEYLHFLRDEYDRDLGKLSKEGLWWEFETYVAYWLSGLFVLVEGFNKVGLKDKRVTRLFNAHVGTLKKMRHETYHFVVEVARGEDVLPELNWAEELHEAIGQVIREHVDRKARVEKMMETRAKKK